MAQRIGNRRFTDIGDTNKMSLENGEWSIDKVPVTASADDLNSAISGVGARVNSTGSTYTRGRLNFIEGGNVEITTADDAGNDEVDITVSVPFVSLLKWGVYG